MKKIIIIGGGEGQVPLIETANKEGYQTIVCDLNPHCLGAPLAKQFYEVSTLDKEAILRIAQEEKTDGIISNSEPAMHVVSYVVEQMGLIGNSTDSIMTLMQKTRFRELQEKVGVYCPKHLSTERIEDLWEHIDQLTFPIIIKPGESSATRGTTRIAAMDKQRISNVYNDCMHYTRNGKVVVEEFVKMPESLILFDGDLFVWQDEILWDGLFFSTRSKFAPLVPTTQTYPLSVDEKTMAKIKDTFTKIFRGAGIRHGEFNVEMYLTPKNDLFVIEINVRQGGNAIPQMIQQHCGVDLTRLLVTTSVGDMYYWEEMKHYQRDLRYICRHPVYSSKEGIYAGIEIDEEIRPFVTHIDYVMEKGEKVESCVNATSDIAFVNLDFGNRETQLKYFDKLNELITVKLK